MLTVEINSAAIYDMTLDSACYMMSQTNVESPGRSVVRKVCGTCTRQQTGNFRYDKSKIYVLRLVSRRFIMFGKEFAVVIFRYKVVLTKVV